jgi:hypothetical protein
MCLNVSAIALIGVLMPDASMSLSYTMTRFPQRKKLWR